MRLTSHNCQHKQGNDKRPQYSHVGIFFAKITVITRRSTLVAAQLLADKMSVRGLIRLRVWGEQGADAGSREVDAEPETLRSPRFSVVLHVLILLVMDEAPEAIIIFFINCRLQLKWWYTFQL